MVVHKLPCISVRLKCRRMIDTAAYSTISQGTNWSSISGLPVVHNHGYVCELPKAHSFPMAKFNIIYDILVGDGLLNPSNSWFSQTGYLMKVPAQYTQMNTSASSSPVKPLLKNRRPLASSGLLGLSPRVRYETGGTLLAARVALERGLACSTAGGTHHAFRDRGSGYCLLNDLAVTARHLVEEANRKVLIVDLDVHQGDGTAAIFSGDDRVFTFSMHCQKNFPLRKQTSDLDVGLDLHTGDAAYMAALREHLAALLQLFRPDLVLYDAGVDPHVDDLLGKLNLTDSVAGDSEENNRHPKVFQLEGLFARDYYVLSEVVRRGIPCASVIGGGYSRDLQVLARRHTIVHRAAARVYGELLS